MALIPNRRDERWNDPSWRTDSFLALIAEHNLSTDELCSVFDREPTTVLHWRSGRYKPIPKIALRLLMLELAVGGRNALI